MLAKFQKDNILGRGQKDREMVEEFAPALRKLAATCKLGEASDERDQFLLTCNIDRIREELWLKDDPPLNKVSIG